MYTPLDEAFVNGPWCRDCVFASKKEVEKMRLRIYCEQYGDIFPTFERPCEHFIRDEVRQNAIGQGLMRLLEKKKKEKEGR